MKTEIKDKINALKKYRRVTKKAIIAAENSMQSVERNKKLLSSVVGVDTDKFLEKSKHIRDYLGKVYCIINAELQQLRG